jgi:sec-independent protein translocase protein TatA
LYAKIISIMNTMLLWTPGVGEIVVIALVVLLLFGGKKIPELMKGLGSGVREFNSAKNTIKSEIEEGMKEPKTEAKTETKETKEAKEAE